MDEKKIQKKEHILFRLGVYGKGLNAFVELVSGVSLLFFSGAVNNIFVSLIKNELIDDPGDSFINYIYQLFHSLSVGASTVLALFILAHGIVNLFLFISLLKEKLWAFPIAIGIVSTFIVYQFYRFSHNHSGALLFVTLLDIAFVILAWLEYKHKKRKRALRMSA